MFFSVKDKLATRRNNSCKKAFNCLYFFPFIILAILEGLDSNQRGR